ncbi:MULTISPECIES: Flp pilus assembly protein CpaB [unclassified Nocardioides]|uniref:Flp pilus assembly protein CpaB n=1 Tax=unclassified Nocardioides TaxID=2615069 RepID=UPI00114F1C27|nr:MULTISPECIES: RcpC/CpaB family pilus assembly protein [unclassified Nocardioides]WGX99990.1 RcpC/CpaB family pilus assembly protein [Nocardioides sp. QY071]
MLLVVAAVIAALGVGLVFVFARGAESRAAEKYQTTNVVTVAAGKTVLPGESIKSALDTGKLAETAVPQGQVLENALRQSDLGDLDGKVALTTLYAGEQLLSTKFGGVGDPVDVASLPLPKGMIAKPESFDLPVGSFIEPGSQLAVFLTVNPSTPTCLLIDRVTVLSKGAQTETATDSSGDAAAEKAPALHLAVTQEQFEWLQDGRERGELSVALLNAESEVQVDKTGPCATIRDSE